MIVHVKREMLHQSIGLFIVLQPADYGLNEQCITDRLVIYTVVQGSFLAGIVLCGIEFCSVMCN
ncbi:hypothetical protein [Desulfobulbus oligotrophicus]|jgi:hypothetical protein|uniref:Uncharacterized protein n=1 Tax=Desulfobulbus oligotrophicus TaxID=1909699 RepID=A0A7T6AR38_9BACT|nr:hypothetical protein [Desulfobulbus oligotrophicus]MDY0391674.1 hypothetical protein [Desulfobulbus oligotrophicus]QQG66140.1 hypothetical protein HP555_09805 [Desulfobulbus oligotrophicus]